MEPLRLSYPSNLIVCTNSSGLSRPSAVEDHDGHALCVQVIVSCAILDANARFGVESLRYLRVWLLGGWDERVGISISGNERLGIGRFR